MDTKERRRRPPSSGKGSPGTSRSPRTRKPEQGRAAPAQRRTAAPHDQQQERRRNTGAPNAAVRDDRRRKNGATNAPKREERRRKTEAPKSHGREDRRRKNGAPNPTAREDRRRQIQKRRRMKEQNPPQRQRIVRPPREEVPSVIYTPPRPMRRGRFLWRLVSMAAVVAAVFFGLSVFFRVDTITVAGADKYTPWMIRQAAGVETGDALLSISEARVASRIISKLPYIDEVKVGVRLPGTVELQVTELQVTYAIRDEGGSWWLISSSGQAVEPVTQEKAMNYTRVEGLTVRTPKQGQTVQAVPGVIVDPIDGATMTLDQAVADDQLETLTTVMTTLEKHRIIGEVSRIDMTDVGDIRLEYPQLLTIRLGGVERMDHKISFLAASKEQLEDSQSCEVDLTLEYWDGLLIGPKS